jgi:hypothetical protein
VRLAGRRLCCWRGCRRGPAQPSEVTQLRLERTEDGVLLNATVRFELPPAVDDALQKGIPMFFVAEATICATAGTGTTSAVAFTPRHMRLSYQPLTRRWRLQVSSAPIGNSGLALGQSFDTQEEALRAVQRVARWKIADVPTWSPTRAQHRLPLPPGRVAAAAAVPDRRGRPGRLERQRRAHAAPGVETGR